VQYRWERRAAKLESRKRKMKKHGKDFGQMYADAILKRVKQLESSPLTKSDIHDIIVMLEDENYLEGI